MTPVKPRSDPVTPVAVVSLTIGGSCLGSLMAEATCVRMETVASAAALILLSVPKERRFGLPNSSYLIHQPLSGIQGVATDIEIHARELEKTKQRLNEIIADATGQSLERVSKDTDRDYWMNCTEAAAYGLISGTISRREELPL